MLSIAYEDGQEVKENTFVNRSAIDVGEIHTIAAVAENGENIIITGRKIRSIHRLRNKKLAELQRKMSQCTKGSKQWKRYNRAKRYMLSKSDDNSKTPFTKQRNNLSIGALKTK